MKKPIRWHAEARRMRADGLSPQRIAEGLGKALSTVREVLRETELMRRITR